MTNDQHEEHIKPVMQYIFDCTQINDNHDNDSDMIQWIAINAVPIYTTA